jgi:heat shock protein HtpX
MAAITALFMWIGNYLGGKQGMVIAFVIAAAMNFFSYWFSDKMVLKHYKAKQVGPEDSSGLYQIVADLAQKAELPMPKVYIIPQQTANAFATGRNPQNSAVAATQGIIKLLDKQELTGVMAHELGHVKHRDILIGTIVATLAGAITMVGQFAYLGGGSSQKRGNPIGLLLVVIGAPLAAVLIRMAVSRVREYAADKAAGQLSKNPLALANALNKLQHGVSKYPLQQANPSHAHMFIVHPFIGGGLQKLFTTHPPTEERIKRLEELSRNM